MKLPAVVVLILTSAALAFPGPRLNSGHQKRDCDCNAYINCSNNCYAFADGTPGDQLSVGMCILSCGGASGCGGDWECCVDNTSCQGDGCCENKYEHITTWSGNNCEGSSANPTIQIGSGFTCFYNLPGASFSVPTGFSGCQITTWSGVNCEGSSAVFAGNQGGCTAIPFGSVSLDCPYN